MKKILCMLAAGALVASSSGAATAAPLCFGRRATIVGTLGGDVIEGTSRSDVIVAGEGDDRVRGGDGDDRICGGGGNDRLFGDDGHDRLEMGRPGWEEVADGGDGRDYLIGGSRNNACDGYWELRGGRGEDRLRAAPDTYCVTMMGGWGDDDLDTGDARGTLIGGPDDDRMTGSGTFEGGAGDDVMTGDAHSRAFFDDPGGVRVDLEQGTAAGPGEGRDTIAGIAGIIGTDGDDVIRGDGARNLITGARGDDQIFGGGGNDELEGQEGDDEVDGGDGDDHVMAAPGRNLVLGGPGDDTVSNEYRVEVAGDPRGTQFDGGDGRDRLFMSLYSTRVKDENVTIDLLGGSSIGDTPVMAVGIEDVDVSGNGTIVLRGDDGPNSLRAYARDGSLEGRGGDDELDPSGAMDLDGGAGVDTASFLGPYGVTIDLVEGTFSSLSASGTVTGIENVIGSWDPDSIRGDDGPNVLAAEWDDDVVEGRGGDDTIDGSLGDDRLDGGDGSDTIDGGDGTDECVNGESVARCE